MTAYSLLLGSAAGSNPATSYTFQSGNNTFIEVAIPSGYNAIHVQYAAGGGGGATGGIDYDKAGGESSGVSGGGGGYASDLILKLPATATLIRYYVPTGGTAGNQTANFKHPRTSGNGGGFSLSAQAVSGPGAALKSLNCFGGQGGSLTGGGVQGPLATGNTGNGGSATFDFDRYNAGQGSFLNSSRQLIAIGNVSELQGGPVGTFNRFGSGSAGAWNGNCSGDNCRIGGASGGSTYGGAIAGGTGGSSAGAGTAGANGTRGSGAGAGAAQVNSGSTNGGVGGDGEFRYRFLDVF